MVVLRCAVCRRKLAFDRIKSENVVFCLFREGGSIDGISCRFPVPSAGKDMFKGVIQMLGPTLVGACTGTHVPHLYGNRLRHIFSVTEELPIRNGPHADVIFGGRQDICGSRDLVMSYQT